MTSYAEQVTIACWEVDRQIFAAVLRDLLHWLDHNASHLFVRGFIVTLAIAIIL